MKILILFTLFLLTADAQEIAFSFDDAPRKGGLYFSGDERADMLIKKLEKLNIKTVFFCTTSHIDSSGLERLKKYSNAGHFIANHSHSHGQIDIMGRQEYIADLKKADKILKDFPTFVRWFRFPYLREGKTIDDRDAVRNALKEMDYMNGYVTIDTYDWYIEAALQNALKEGKKVDYEKLKDFYVQTLWDCMQFYDGIAKKILGRSPRHVLLLHENDLAALFIDELAAFLQNKGWKIISPDEAYKDPISKVTTKTLMNNQGRVAAIAKDQNYAGPFSHPTEDNKKVDALIKKYRIFK